MHDDLAELQNEYPESNIYYCTTKTEIKYTEPEYKAGDIFVFGPESRGIPEDILLENKENTITIPMSEKIRSINLSNSVAIVLYEALRQVDWDDEDNVSRRIIC